MRDNPRCTMQENALWRACTSSERFASRPAAIRFTATALLYPLCFESGEKSFPRVERTPGSRWRGVFCHGSSYFARPHVNDFRCLRCTAAISPLRKQMFAVPRFVLLQSLSPLRWTSVTIPWRVICKRREREGEKKRALRDKSRRRHRRECPGRPTSTR